jgi:outer membrane protein TolC
MHWMVRVCAPALGIAGLLGADVAAAQPMTADQAVEIALQNNVTVIGAEAGVDDARGSQYAALAGVLPSVSLSASRSGFWQNDRSGNQVFGGVIVPTDKSDLEQFSTTPTVRGSWNVLDLSGLTGVSSARTGLRAALNTQQATRNDVAFETRRQFYEVVKAIKTAFVNAEAAKLARNEERRVAALFEVGSVSKSDLLQAQVRTAQSELDSLVSYNDITIQRIALATQLGVEVANLGVVDTTLAPTGEAYDESALLDEAAKNRPDLVAAEAEFQAAKAGLRSSNFLRWPFVSLGGSATFQPRTTFKVTEFESAGVPLPTPTELTGESENDMQYGGEVALNWNVFDGLRTDGQIAASRARLMRAESARDQFRRDLASEVKEALLRHREATEGLTVARRSFESSEESLKLIQQKYNVGSATILELITAQVSLQRAANTYVAALAQIKVAEAAIKRVRGRNE